MNTRTKKPTPTKVEIRFVNQVVELDMVLEALEDPQRGLSESDRQSLTCRRDILRKEITAARAMIANAG